MHTLSSDSAVYPRVEKGCDAKQGICEVYANIDTKQVLGHCMLRKDHALAVEEHSGRIPGNLSTFRASNATDENLSMLILFI